MCKEVEKNVTLLSSPLSILVGVLQMCFPPNHAHSLLLAFIYIVPSELYCPTKSSQMSCPNSASPLKRSLNPMLPGKIHLALPPQSFMRF